MTSIDRILARRLISLLALLSVLSAATATAQPSSSGIRPADFGFDIPPGPLRRGEGRRVTTTDAAGNPVVALLHTEVGENSIVMLPDGSLHARKPGETAATERAFEPESAVALAARLMEGEFAGFRVKKGARYLFIYNTSEPFAQTTSRILETMFRGVVLYAQAQKIDVHAPRVPLVVVMFRNHEEMSKHRRLPSGLAAYYHTVDNRIYLCEPSAKSNGDLPAAVRQSVSTIAHEGAHQILNNIGVQQRLSVWPMWLGEGLAEFFAPTSTGRRLTWKGAGQPNDFRLYELQRYLQSNSNSNGSTMIEQTVGAARLTSTGYASAWALTHYLATSRRADFKKYLTETSKLAPLQGDLRVFSGGVVPANLTGFKAAFGADLTEIERRMLLHVRKLPYRNPNAP